MEKKLDLKAKTIISLVLFVAVFAALVAVATVYDLKISQTLTKDALPADNYFSTNGFGLFFEAVGSAPIWLMLSLAGAIVFWKAVRVRNKGVRYVFAIGGAIVVLVPLFLFVADIFKYVGEHMHNEAYMDSTYVRLLELLLGVMLGGSLLTMMRTLKPQTINKLIPWVFVIVGCVACYLIISFVKSPVGRVRYRTMNYLGDFSLFTKWFEVNGSRNILPVAHGVEIDDSCKSFPSGHTFSAGLIYTLLCLPYILERFNTKGWKTALWIITIGFTGVVAVSRIVVGAHFMSDVLFGGTIAFVACMIFRELFICQNAHLKALFGKKKPQIVEETEEAKLAA